MRQNVDGRWYDTESADDVAHRSGQVPGSPWERITDSVHRTSHGEWFLADWVNASVTPITEDDAVRWMADCATGYSDDRLWSRYGPDGRRRGRHRAAPSGRSDP